jgi:CRISPR-associated endoribonuclease Cas6
MRLRVEVVTTATEVPWPQVLAPGRGLAYDFLGRVAPELGRQLHSAGWGPHGMVPFGHSAPIFPKAPRQRGKYAAGGRGFLEFGSPLTEVVDAWAAALRQREILDWGGVALRITSIVAVEPPPYESGYARMRTSTPVVMKGDGRLPDGSRGTRQAWLLPTETEFASYFQRNLQRKLETLGIDGEVSLEGIPWVGAKRSFGVGGGLKPGAPLEAELRGDPTALRALWSWGLGQANSAGFGWVSQ